MSPRLGPTQDGGGILSGRLLTDVRRGDPGGLKLPGFSASDQNHRVSPSSRGRNCAPLAPRRPQPGLSLSDSEPRSTHAPAAVLRPRAARPPWPSRVSSRRLPLLLLPDPPALRPVSPLKEPGARAAAENVRETHSPAPSAGRRQPGLARRARRPRPCAATLLARAH